MRISDWSSDVCSSDLQELLYTLTYDNSVAEPTAWIRTIEIQADDGGASNNLSLVAIASIPVTAADAQPPVLAANQMTIDAGGTAVPPAAELASRSEAPRVGKECFRTGSSRGLPTHQK